MNPVGARYRLAGKTPVPLGRMGRVGEPGMTPGTLEAVSCPTTRAKGHPTDTPTDTPPTGKPANTRIDTGKEHTMLQTCRRPGIFVTGLIAVMVVGCLAEGLFAQSRRPSRRQPAVQPGQQAQPTQPGATAPSPWDDLEPNPFLKRKEPRRWTVTVNMHIGAVQWLESRDGGSVPNWDTWEFDAATLVYPVVEETASSILEVYGSGAEEVPAVKGKVELDDRPVADTMTILKQGIGGGLLPSGTWRGQWQIEPAQRGAHSVREMEFEISVAQVCYQTVFDERGALEVEWPTGDWPPEAAASFQPQMFVDFDMQGRGYD
ncbi:hypothetical protein MNBD_PLANCTO03-886, partial [hydrothermal vent metagenome]